MEEPTLAEQAAATSAQTLSSIKGSKVELISKSKESLGNLISSEKGSTSKLSNKGGETPRNNDDQKEIVTNSSAPTSARASRIGSKDNLAGSRLLASKEVNKSGDKLTSTAPHSQSNLVKSATSKAASKSNIRNAESVSALKKPSSIMGSTRKLENQEAAPSKKESAAGSRAGSKTLSRSGSSSDLKSRLASKTGSRVASKHQLQQEESQHSFHGSSTNLSKAQSSQSIGSRVDDNDPLIQELRDILAQTVEVPTNDEPVGTDAWATDIVQQNEAEEAIEELCWELARSIIKEAKNDLASEQRAAADDTEDTKSKSVSKSGAMPASKPASKPVSKPISKSVSKPASAALASAYALDTKTTSRPISRPMSKPVSRPISNPTSNVGSKPVSRVASKPISRSGSQAVLVEAKSKVGSQAALQRSDSKNVTASTEQQYSKPASKYSSQAKLQGNASKVGSVVLSNTQLPQANRDASKQVSSSNIQSNAQDTNATPKNSSKVTSTAHLPQGYDAANSNQHVLDQDTDDKSKNISKEASFAEQQHQDDTGAESHSLKASQQIHHTASKTASKVSSTSQLPNDGVVKTGSTPKQGSLSALNGEENGDEVGTKATTSDAVEEHASSKVPSQLQSSINIARSESKPASKVSSQLVLNQPNSKPMSKAPSHAALSKSQTGSNHASKAGSQSILKEVKSSKPISRADSLREHTLEDVHKATSNPASKTGSQLALGSVGSNADVGSSRPVTSKPVSKEGSRSELNEKSESVSKLVNDHQAPRSNTTSNIPLENGENIDENALSTGSKTASGNELSQHASSNQDPIDRTGKHNSEPSSKMGSTHIINSHNGTKAASRSGSQILQKEEPKAASRSMLKEDTESNIASTDVELEKPLNGALEQNSEANDKYNSTASNKNLASKNLSQSNLVKGSQSHVLAQADSAIAHSQSKINSYLPNSEGGIQQVNDTATASISKAGSRQIVSQSQSSKPASKPESKRTSQVTSRVTNEVQSNLSKPPSVSNIHQQRAESKTMSKSGSNSALEDGSTKLSHTTSKGALADDSYEIAGHNSSGSEQVVHSESKTLHSSISQLEEKQGTHSKTSTKQGSKTVSKPTSKPVSKPASKTVSKPVSKPSSRPGSKPVSKISSQNGSAEHLDKEHHEKYEPHEHSRLVQEISADNESEELTSNAEAVNETVSSTLSKGPSNAASISSSKPVSQPASKAASRPISKPVTATHSKSQLNNQNEYSGESDAAYAEEFEQHNEAEEIKPASQHNVAEAFTDDHALNYEEEFESSNPNEQMQSTSKPASNPVSKPASKPNSRPISHRASSLLLSGGTNSNSKTGLTGDYEEVVTSEPVERSSMNNLRRDSKNGPEYKSEEFYDTVEEQQVETHRTPLKTSQTASRISSMASSKAASKNGSKADVSQNSAPDASYYEDVASGSVSKPSSKPASKPSSRPGSNLASKRASKYGSKSMLSHEVTSSIEGTNEYQDEPLSNAAQTHTAEAAYDLDEFDADQQESETVGQHPPVEDQVPGPPSKRSSSTKVVESGSRTMSRQVSANLATNSKRASNASQRNSKTVASELESTPAENDYTFDEFDEAHQKAPSKQASVAKLADANPGKESKTSSRPASARPASAKPGSQHGSKAFVSEQESTPAENEYSFDEFDEVLQKAPSKQMSIAKLVDSNPKKESKSSSRPASARPVSAKPGSHSISKSTSQHHSKSNIAEQGGNEYNFDDFDIGGISSNEVLDPGAPGSIKNLEETAVANSIVPAEVATNDDDEYDFSYNDSSIPSHIVSSALIDDTYKSSTRSLRSLKNSSGNLPGSRECMSVKDSSKSHSKSKLSNSITDSTKLDEDRVFKRPQSAKAKVESVVEPKEYQPPVTIQQRSPEINYVGLVANLRREISALRKEMGIRDDAIVGLKEREHDLRAYVDASKTKGKDSIDKNTRILLDRQKKAYQILVAKLRREIRRLNFQKNSLSDPLIESKYFPYLPRTPYGSSSRTPPYGIIGNLPQRSSDYFPLNPPPPTGNHIESGNRWWWGSGPDLSSHIPPRKTSKRPVTGARTDGSAVASNDLQVVPNAEANSTVKMPLIANRLQQLIDDYTQGEARVGDRGCVVINNERVLGMVKYVGIFDPYPESGLWCGIKLDRPLGKHDGVVRGKRYFTCEENHGLFVKLEKIIPMGPAGGKRLSTTRAAT